MKRGLGIEVLVFGCCALCFSSPSVAVPTSTDNVDNHRIIASSLARSHTKERERQGDHQLRRFIISRSAVSPSPSRALSHDHPPTQPPIRPLFLIPQERYTHPPIHPTPDGDRPAGEERGREAFFRFISHPIIVTIHPWLAGGKTRERTPARNNSKPADRNVVNKRRQTTIMLTCHLDSSTDAQPNLGFSPKITTSLHE